MDNIQVKFGDWIEGGFNLYKDNFGILVLASLIALLLSAASVGILFGPMMAGLIMITLALIDGQTPKPEVGLLFRGFNFFVQTFLFFLVWGLGLVVVSFIVSLVPCIGQLAALFVFYAAQTFLMFAVFLIVEQNREFWPASMESYETVKPNFWPFLGLCIVSGIIGSIGAIACGIGVFITFPIQVCILSVAYRDVFSETGPSAAVAEIPADDGNNHF